MGKSDVVQEWVQVATPADPDAGYSKPYFKSDGKLYGKTGSTETLIGPGGGAGTVELWRVAGVYAVGDLVGHNGKIWKCIAASAAGRAPSMWTTLWKCLYGAPYDEWAQMDPFFTGNDLTSWSTFWTVGTAPVSLTNTAGEFETGFQALKVTMSASSSKRLFELDENVVRGGEIIVAKVRAKISSLFTLPATLSGALLQNDTAGSPEPLATGLTITTAKEGAQALTANWETYTFTVYAANAKPRAMFNIILDTVAGGAATVVIDRIEITRMPPYIDTLDWRSLTLSGGVLLPNAAITLAFNQDNGGSGITASGGTFTVVKAGIYHVSSSVTVNQISGGQFVIVSIRQIRNAAAIKVFDTVGYPTLANTWQNIAVDGIFNALAGDKFDVTVQAQVNGAGSADAGRCHFNIHQLSTSGSSNGELTAGFRGTTAQSILNTTYTGVLVNNTPDHSCGGVSVSGAIVTVETAGVYQYIGEVQYSASPTNMRAFLRIEGWSGTDPGVGFGTSLAHTDNTYFASNWPGLNVSGQAFLPAGYKLRLVTWQGSGSTMNLNGGTQPQKLNVRKVSQGGIPGDTGWINMTLVNSWVVNSGRTASYRRIGNNLYSRGTISGGASGTSAFTLPASFRPGQFSSFVCASGAPNAPAAINIDNAGVATVYLTAGQTTCALDEVSFIAEA